MRHFGRHAPACPVTIVALDFAEGDVRRRVPYRPAVDVIGGFLDGLPAAEGLSQALGGAAAPRLPRR